jgi:RNA polymerase sigma factor (TIGR02999 family)
VELEILCGKVSLRQKRETSGIFDIMVSVPAPAPAPPPEPTPLPGALDEIVPLVYEELKQLARRQHFGDPVTLSTTELVHEAVLKLSGGATSTWEGRAHFFGAAARAMRQVLVDFARRREAAKRGGGFERVTLGSADGAVEIELDEIVALEAALDRLGELNPRLRQVVELRFYAGLSESDIARMLKVSARTIERDWLKARLILLQALGRE